MKLTRLRVAELRRFRAPFELAEIQPGLNIFTAANEAGKSTLVRAIRAAFFERHKSSSVDDLRPYDDSAAAPEVELDFEIAGTPYRLSKRFLKKMRCDLVIGARRLEGVEAEDALAERLGLQFALKGASREEHWGIPGLLWIEQGSAHVVRDAVVNAADHLRKALDESPGEVSASGGDEVVAQVRKWRDELLTGTGKPKASFQKAIDDATAFEQRVAQLQQAVATYRSQVDLLKLLRDAHAADTSTQPWAALRARQAQAQQALQAAEALAGERDRAQERLRQVAGLRDVLGQWLTAAEQQQQGLVAREASLTSTASKHEQATALEALAVLAEAAAAERWRSARETLALARQEDNRRVLNRQVADARTRPVELGSLLERATTESDRAISLKGDAARLWMAPADLAMLREQHARLTELRIRQATVATRLRFELDAGVMVDLGGEAVSGQAERLPVAPAVVTVLGVGRLHIVPGGSDLTEVAQDQARMHDEHSALLQRLGLASLAGAEARDRQIVQVETALAAAGAQGLQEDLERAQSANTQAQRRAAELRRRAEALDHLLQKLEQRRQALTRRLQAPLQKHLDRFLQLLFPSGRLEVDEHLVPGALTRPGPRGPEAGDFETLSFGAREQMGVISRLAYADLLKEAGRPTLIILDDALVHSDAQRLAQMKRVLFDAAQRHQVLLFTCHPGSWPDMGVPLRPLEEVSSQ